MSVRTIAAALALGLVLPALSAQASETGEALNSLRSSQGRLAKELGSSKMREAEGLAKAGKENLKQEGAAWMAALQAVKSLNPLKHHDAVAGMVVAHVKNRFDLAADVAGVRDAAKNSAAAALAEHGMDCVELLGGAGVKVSVRS